MAAASPIGVRKSIELQWPMLAIEKQCNTRSAYEVSADLAGNPPITFSERADEASRLLRRELEVCSDWSNVIEASGETSDESIFLVGERRLVVIPRIHGRCEFRDGGMPNGSRRHRPAPFCITV